MGHPSLESVAFLIFYKILLQAFIYPKNNVRSYWFGKYFTCQIPLNQGEPTFLGWKKKKSIDPLFLGLEEEEHQSSFSWIGRRRRASILFFLDWKKKKSINPLFLGLENMG